MRSNAEITTSAEAAFIDTSTQKPDSVEDTYPITIILCLKWLEFKEKSGSFFHSTNLFCPREKPTNDGGGLLSERVLETGFY